MGSKKTDFKEYTFVEWSAFWFENHKEDITPTTQENYKYTLKILNDYFGEDLITEIKAMDVETFLKKMRSDGRSKSYISTCRGLLHQIFRKAEANELIDKNPVALADKLRSREPKKKKEAFTTEEGVRVLTPHSCRHTYVSQMQALGIDLETIRHVVGHADIDMTEHYLHLQKSKINQAVELFGAEFGVDEE